MGNPSNIPVRIENFKNKLFTDLTWVLIKTFTGKIFTGILFLFLFYPLYQDFQMISQLFQIV